MNRTKQITRGPNLPAELHFPCVIDINEDLIFIIGLTKHVNEGIENNTLSEYLFNRTDEGWSDVGQDFPCPLSGSIDTRFTCAYLKPDHSIITEFESCIATFNVTSLMWTSNITMPIKDGLLFNINEELDSIVYIGSNGTHSSLVYMVSWVHQVNVVPITCRSHYPNTVD